MPKTDTRRNFLRTAPLATAAAFTLSEALLGPSSSEAQSTAVPFQLFNAQSLEAYAKALQAAPGNKSLVDAKQLPITVVMTTETAHSAKEFEWHEGRDHIVQILDGSTLYDLGGTPKNGRNTKPSEWLAPTSDGSAHLTLNKGDMLLIPRNTPHKRSTPGTVTFLLVSSVGAPTP